MALVWQPKTRSPENTSNQYQIANPDGPAGARAMTTVLAPQTPALPAHARARRLAFFSELASGRSSTPVSRSIQELSPHVEALRAELNGLEAALNPTPAKPQTLELQSVNTPTLNPSAIEFRLPPPPSSPPKPSTHLSVLAPEFVPGHPGTEPAPAKAKGMLSATAAEFVPPTANAKDEHSTYSVRPVDQLAVQPGAQASTAPATAELRAQLQRMAHELDATRKRAANAENLAMEQAKRLGMCGAIERELGQMRIAVGVARQAAQREVRVADDLRKRITTLGEQLREANEAKAAVVKTLDAHLTAQREERERERMRMQCAAAGHVAELEQNAYNKRQRADVLPGWERMPANVAANVAANASLIMPSSHVGGACLNHDAVLLLPHPPAQMPMGPPVPRQPTAAPQPSSLAGPMGTFACSSSHASSFIAHMRTCGPTAAAPPPAARHTPAPPPVAAPPPPSIVRSESAPMTASAPESIKDAADDCDADEGNVHAAKSASRSRRGGRGKGHKNRAAAAAAAAATQGLTTDGVGGANSKEWTAGKDWHSSAALCCKENAPSNQQLGSNANPFAPQTLQHAMQRSDASSA